MKVFFVLVLVLTLPCLADAAPSREFTDEQIQEIRNLLERQRADANSEKETSLHWYKKFLDLQGCITSKARNNEPAMACIAGNKPM